MSCRSSAAVAQTTIRYYVNAHTYAELEVYDLPPSRSELSSLGQVLIKFEVLTMARRKSQSLEPGRVVSKLRQ
jgi:hypothetical protein